MAEIHLISAARVQTTQTTHPTDDAPSLHHVGRPPLDDERRVVLHRIANKLQVVILLSPISARVVEDLLDQLIAMLKRARRLQ